MIRTQDICFSDVTHLCHVGLFFFWPHPATCGILVPRPGIEPVPPALEAQRLNWTVKEILDFFFFKQGS